MSSIPTTTRSVDAEFCNVSYPFLAWQIFGGELQRALVGDIENPGFVYLGRVHEQRHFGGASFAEPERLHGPKRDDTGSGENVNQERSGLLIAVEGQGYMGTTAWTQRWKEMMGTSGFDRQPYDRHWFVPSFGNFECKPLERPGEDGKTETVPQYVVIGAVTTAASRALGEVLGADTLAEHCKDSWQMFQHRDEIGASIEERTKQMTPDEVIELIGKIPAQKHVHLEEVVDDKHLRDRNMIAPVMASDGEEMLIANYDGAEFDPAPAMVHGQHTEELLLEAGYSLDDIDTMSKEKMVFCATRRPRP